MKWKIPCYQKSTIKSLPTGYFLLFADLTKSTLPGIPSISNSLDPDQARRSFVGSHLGPNCSQMLSADNTSR